MKVNEKLAIAIAWALPRDIAKWAAIRVASHATTGPYSNQEVPALLVTDMLKRWEDPTIPPLPPLSRESKWWFLKRYAELFGFPQRWERRMFSTGLIVGALIPEVDKLDGLPEFQRPWYEEDPQTKKYKLNLSKVDVEDVTGLKSTVQATREEAKRAKEEAERRVAETLKQFEGIDPKQAREMMAQFASEEERKLMAQGPAGVQKVIETRMQKYREDLESKLKQHTEERDGALEVASTLMENAVDNHVRAAASKAGMYPGAIEDALLRARQIFSLDDELKPVQFDNDGETVILNKDGKPFTVEDWIEERRKDCPHWFPAADSGTGAPGSKKKVGGGPDLSGLTPQARMTAYREAQAAAGRKS